jgi:AcrR family transcriptional regulator
MTGKNMMKDTKPSRENPKRSLKKSTGCRRNAETSRAILQAAAAILQEKGYANFTIEEVARRSGASKSTIYRWWSNKMGLLFDSYAGESEKKLVIPDFGNVEKEIIFLVRFIWRFWRETPSGQAFKLMIAEAQTDPSAVAEWRTRFLPERRKILLFVLHRAADRGELRSDIDFETVIDIMFGYSWYRLLTGQIDDDLTVISTMVREVVQGITRKD